MLRALQVVCLGRPVGVRHEVRRVAANEPVHEAGQAAVHLAQVEHSHAAAVRGVGVAEPLEVDFHELPEVPAASAPRGRRARLGVVAVPERHEVPGRAGREAGRESPQVAVRTLEIEAVDGGEVVEVHPHHEAVVLAGAVPAADGAPLVERAEAVVAVGRLAGVGVAHRRDVVAVPGGEGGGGG